MLRTFSGRDPSQNEHELAAFIALLNAEGVTRYGEIGAREGDTFHEVMSHLPAGSRGVAMDLPGGKWGTPTSAEKLKKAVIDLSKRGYYVSCVFGDSQTDATARLFLSHGSFDAILIDGDHSLDAVTADWRRYRSRARLVAFHDIAGVGQKEKKANGAPVEVPALWRSIRSNGHKTAEFIAPRSRMGIGVVWTS